MNTIRLIDDYNNDPVMKVFNDELKQSFLDDNLDLKEIEKLRENVGSLTKENTDLNIKVNAKQELVRGLKEALGIEEAVEEENIEMVTGVHFSKAWI